MIASFVIDASMALAWCFRDEETPATKALLDRLSNEAAAVPAWWCIEVANVLALGERRGRLTEQETEGFFSLIGGFALDIDSEATSRAFTHLLPLCRAHRLTSYDAVYLELALRRQLPLATIGHDLAKAAKKIGIKVLGR